MKLIEKHNNPAPIPWYAGKRVTCDNCGSVHELEADDRLYDYYSHDKRVVSFSCMNCRMATARCEPK